MIQISGISSAHLLNLRHRQPTLPQTFLEETSNSRQLYHHRALLSSITLTLQCFKMVDVGISVLSRVAAVVAVEARLDVVDALGAVLVVVVAVQVAVVVEAVVDFLAMAALAVVLVHHFPVVVVVAVVDP